MTLDRNCAMYASTSNYDQDCCLADGDVSKNTYCGEFTNNLLVIGQAGSGNTHFVENLLANEFVKGHDLIWISSEKLSDNLRKSYHDRFKAFQVFSFYMVVSPKGVNKLLLQLLLQMQERFQNEKRKTVMMFDNLLNIADKSE